MKHKKEGVKVTCKHCGYTWIYGGKLLLPTCPSCHRNTPTQELIQLRKQYPITKTTRKYNQKQKVKQK